MPIDPLEDYPGYSLRRASAVNMAKLARRFAAIDLRPTEATVLMVIDANPNISQSEIGKMLDIARAIGLDQAGFAAALAAGTALDDDRRSAFRAGSARSWAIRSDIRFQPDRTGQTGT